MHKTKIIGPSGSAKREAFFICFKNTGKPVEIFNAARFGFALRYAF